jgi:pimeloyl-ACP methyl ester carboxylesterase
MSVLIFLIIAGAFLISALTYAYYCYEVLNLDRESFDPEAHGGMRRLVLVGFASSLVSQVAVAVTYVFGFLRRFSEPASGGGTTRPPVILVHGIYHNPAAWMLFRRRLGRRGYRTVYCFGYFSFGPGFDEIADALGRTIREVSEKQHGARVILIGHSLGGLLIRVALGTPETAALVRTVVTLGTPYRGSKLAVLGLGALAANLVPGSPLLGRLPAFPDPEQTPWLCLTSPADNMVLPVTALAPDAEGPVHRETPVVCHVGMIYHKPTADMAIAFLDATVRRQEGAAP